MYFFENSTGIPQYSICEFLALWYLFVKIICNIWNMKTNAFLFSTFSLFFLRQFRPFFCFFFGLISILLFSMRDRRLGEWKCTAPFCSLLTFHSILASAHTCIRKSQDPVCLCGVSLIVVVHNRECQNQSHAAFVLLCQRFSFFVVVFKKKNYILTLYWFFVAFLSYFLNGILRFFVDFLKLFVLCLNLLFFNFLSCFN